MPRPGTMTYLVSYDIPSTKAGDRRRAKLARNLVNYGLRVQYSIFEVSISPEKIDNLLTELTSYINPKEDSIRIYPLCGTCRDKAIILGVKATIEYEAYFIM